MLNGQNLKDIVLCIPFLNYLFLNKDKSVIFEEKIFSHNDDVFCLSCYNLAWIFGYYILNN